MKKMMIRVGSSEVPITLEADYVGWEVYVPDVPLAVDHNVYTKEDVALVVRECFEDWGRRMPIDEFMDLVYMGLSLL